MSDEKVKVNIEGTATGSSRDGTNLENDKEEANNG